MTLNSISWYDTHASRLVSSYEAAPPILARDWLARLLPKPPALVIDIGSGTGRDAAAFASAGYEVLAIEPSGVMRAEAQALHPAAQIRWLPDHLPGLPATSRLGVSGNVVLLSAVWQHVAPLDRPRAFRKLVGLLNSGGLLVMTLRNGPDDGRGGHPTDLGEVENLARNHGMAVLHTSKSDDLQQRPGVTWTNVVLQLPDDGTGALPLIRHLILADAKSASYKLGLLRCLCRIADGTSGLATEDGESHISLPLGLVALYWLRLYMPLIIANLPQAPGNPTGARGLGFGGPGWHAVIAGAATPRDLRVGATFTGAAAAAVHMALREAADHVCQMPANFLTFPAGGKIFQTDRRRPLQKETLVLDGPTLASFGTLKVPLNLWNAMQRFSVWIEPALLSEWSRLMQVYAVNQGRNLEPGAIAAAMTWSDPTRDVMLPRAKAISFMEAGNTIYCVWSGKRLTSDKLDIDHCIPWSAWPCGDLWNLVPADRRINQNEKRERLPSADMLATASDAITAWWTMAYLNPAEKVIQTRFVTEAYSSLPMLDDLTASDVQQVQSAVALQRMRVRQYQGVPEWTWKP